MVELRGELDLATGPMLQQHLEPYNRMPKSDGPPRRIIYQLSGLGFMDGTGLKALLTAIDGHAPTQSPSGNRRHWYAEFSNWSGWTR